MLFKLNREINYLNLNSNLMSYINIIYIIIPSDNNNDSNKTNNNN